MKINGFTLIELLVVISIIAILSSVAVVAYNGITAKTRDNQRIKDLQAIKQGLELYRSDIHNYPTSTDFQLQTKPPSLIGVNTTYLQIPLDPDDARNYYYLALPENCDNSSAIAACLNFILCAKKEGIDTAYNLSACSDFVCGSGLGKCDIGISSQ